MRSGRHRAALALAAMAWAASGPAWAATVTVPTTRLDVVTDTRDLVELRPSACSAITIQNLVTGAGSFNATGQDDLVLGGPNGQGINGRNGDDCILGGAGIDTITGGNGSDVCIGGAGLDIFIGCETQVQ